MVSNAGEPGRVRPCDMVATPRQKLLSSPNSAGELTACGLELATSAHPIQNPLCDEYRIATDDLWEFEGNRSLTVILCECVYMLAFKSQGGVRKTPNNPPIQNVEPQATDGHIRITP